MANVEKRIDNVGSPCFLTLLVQKLIRTLVLRLVRRSSGGGSVLFFGKGCEGLSGSVMGRDKKKRMERGNRIILGRHEKRFE